MKFETAAQTAARLGVTVRAVQKWAKEGKIDGAQKVGRDWMIPTDSGVAKNDTVSLASYIPYPFFRFRTMTEIWCKRWMIFGILIAEISLWRSCIISGEN